MTSISILGHPNLGPSVDLALRCSALTRELVDGGHRTLARKLYVLFRDENLKAVMSFLRDINRSMPSINTDELSHRLMTWGRTGEPLKTLLDEPNFASGETYARGTSIAEIIEGRNLNELMGTVRHLLNGTSSVGKEQSIDSGGETSHVIIQQLKHLQTDSVDLSKQSADNYIDNQSTIQSAQLKSPAAPNREDHNTFLSPPLVVGVILMCQILTVFFCLYR
jgi:hypothetical protein